MTTVADYRQTDSRWSGIKYAGFTVYGSGCGPTACANLIHTVNPNITPADTAKWAEANGYTAYGQGTYWGGIKAIMEHWKMECQMLNWSNAYGNKNSAAEKEWKEKMITGKYYGILLMGPSKFTSSGHYITVVSWDGTYVDVRDPYTGAFSRKHPWSDFDSCVKIFYLVTKEGKVTAKYDQLLYAKDYTYKYTAKISKGTEVEVISDDGYGMSKIRANGKVGWTYNYKLSDTSLSKCRRVKIAKTTYAYPDKRDTVKNIIAPHRILKGRIKAVAGKTVVLFCTGKKWARIKIDGKVRWVLKSRIQY